MVDVPKKAPALDDQGKDNAAHAKLNIETNQAEQKKADPLMARSDMTKEQVEAASPNHILVPDPLPALNRPIFEPPRHPVLSSPLQLHPTQLHPAVEAAVEELRMRLGELREFLKRFDHEIGGELGALVTHLKSDLGVPRVSMVLDEARRQEDRATAERRNAEDLAAGIAPSAALIQRRSEEDAGKAHMRRIQDLTP